MELLCAWLPTKTLSRENSYINLLYTTDIKLCLSFSNEEVSSFPLLVLCVCMCACVHVCVHA